MPHFHLFPGHTRWGDARVMGPAPSPESTLPVTFPLPLSGAGLARVRQVGVL